MTKPLPDKPPNERTRRLLILAPVAWGGLVLALSLMPQPPSAGGLLGMDKLLHAGAYALLAFLVAWSLYASRWFHGNACLAAFVITVVFGGSLEILQGLMQLGRAAEWGDLVADGVGALAACVVFRRAMMLPWFRNLSKG